MLPLFIHLPKCLSETSKNWNVSSAYIWINGKIQKYMNNISSSEIVIGEKARKMTLLIWNGIPPYGSWHEWLYPPILLTTEKIKPRHRIILDTHIYVNENNSYHIDQCKDVFCITLTPCEKHIYMYLHFLSFLKIRRAQVVEILTHGRQEPTHTIQWIQSLCCQIISSPDIELIFPEYYGFSTRKVNINK